MSKYFPPADDDLTFLRKAMQDVKRTKKLPAVPRSPKKSSCVRASFNAMPKKIADHSLPAPLFVLYDPVEQVISAEDKLFFRRAGPQNKVIQKLVRGEMMRSACLDLHGMTVDQARLTIIEFLLASQKAGFRCVHIIHGKGHLSQTQPKLKNHLNYWLAQFPGVLAFTSAQARDGGTGAVYVLLANHS